jgi:hypothetical protein
VVDRAGFSFCVGELFANADDHWFAACRKGEGERLADESL